MFPSPPGPYKSRLFNYLSSQSVKLKDKLQRGLRQLKNAATLGLQIVLYPVYLLVQASRLTGGQLGPNVKKLPRLLKSPAQAIPSEQPIVRILETIEPHLLICEETETLKLHQILNPYHKPGISQFSTTIQKTAIPALAPETKPIIQLQGLATILGNRHLALVGSENLVLDILSLEEQQRLEKRIRLEMANYYHQNRLQSQFKQKVTDFDPVLEPVNEKALAPIRWLWEIMRWEQQGEIAISINLFGESTLVPLTPDFPMLSAAEFLARLEGTPLASVGAWWEKVQPNLSGNQPSNLAFKEADDLEAPYWQGWPIQKLIQAAITYFYGRFSSSPSLSGEPSPTVIEIFKEQVQSWLVPVKATRDNPFTLEVLIQAALEYFFQQRQLQIEGNNDIRGQLSEADDDPWLVWDDLYPEVVQPDDSPPYAPRYRALKPTPPLPQRSPRPVKPKQPQPLTAREAELLAREDEWIDTEAQPVGYVKHPLETILEGLDRIMLWLEELLLAIYQGLRSLWQKRKKRP